MAAKVEKNGWSISFQVNIDVKFHKQMRLYKEEESKALIYFKHEYNNLIWEVKENLEWVQY
ncbi:hypothetical protein FPV21_01995 [Carnobacterium sp. PL12RED10]|uniref:hypothetical protein n=1 Tax=Carnobacterium sp. PL12RED10 TaxID=2592351 RepID=UPI0011EEF42A|nr:hypothetical protein [Carnobacterium sp. PL12RED10]KAF3301683.1 hypothetical protein FPV21_01995 [Carnobacterium sp. PL12RED10]